MRPSGQTKLGFFPLPIGEATRLKNCLAVGWPPQEPQSLFNKK
jgi:hypothetical protein